jgi:hypothetical protein
MTDYLAVISIGAGSSFGRASDKEEAIKLAIRNYRDWDHLFVVSDTDVVLNVVDVQGYGQCSWGAYPGGWLYGTNEATGKHEKIDRPVEHITRRTPKWRKRK